MVHYDDHTAGVSHYYGYDEAGNIDAYDTYDLTGENAFDSDEYEYTDGKLTSFNGGTISYDSSGRTVYYRGKAITYFDEDANAIKSIGNATFTYNADGLRRSKTVNGVTHYYYYDGINLVKEEWGDNILVFFYDANGSPVGMQYRDLSDDEGSWDTYLYEKNLQGDIVAVYNTFGTKLVSYSYDAWGRILSITNGNNQDVTNNASHIGNINPMRYRGYYYDDDLDLYYLATRYYDPVVRRFVTQDSALYHNMLGYNMYAYCNNNPVNYVDNTGESPEAFLAGWTSIMGIIASIEPTVIGEIVLVIGIGVILAINADPISYDDILFNDRVIPRSIGQESSILTLDTYETTKIDEYDPNPYRRPGEKKQNRENRTKARTKQGWEPRNNKRNGKPAKPKSHTPSKKGHKKYFVFASPLERDGRIEVRQ